MLCKQIEKQMQISSTERKDLVNSLKEEIANIQKLRNRFTDERKKSFKDNFKKFYEWYYAQGEKCCYCGISQDELHKLFKIKKCIPLNDAFKRSNGTLEIERKNSHSNTYSEENMALACPLCNNAKSNLINEENWREFFVSPMRNYYEKILGEKLSNPIPTF